MVGGLVLPPAPLELVAGSVVAVIATIATAAAWHAIGLRARWPRGVLRAVVRLPWQILRGYLRVVRVGLSPRRGAVHGSVRQERAGDVGRDGPIDSGVRAWAGWVRSFAADKVVIGFPRDDIITVHVLPSDGRR